MTTTDRPFTGGPARRPETRQAQPDPPARRLPAISKETAEQEAPRERVFTPPYAEKVYTVHAVSPQGFAVDLAFADISLETLEKHMAKLIERGWKA